MNQQQYRDLSTWVCKTPLRKKTINLLCQVIPNTLFLLYILASLYVMLELFRNGFDSQLLPFWIVPAVGFFIVTIIRKKLNHPRPDECFDFIPLRHHEHGLSFPSRHSASAFLVSYGLWYLHHVGKYPLSLVILALVLSVLTAVSRVVAGVHFPKDVIAGFIFATIISVVGFAIFLL